MQIRYLGAVMFAMFGVLSATGCATETSNGGDAPGLTGEQEAAGPRPPVALTNEPGRDVTAEQVGNPGSLNPLPWVGDPNRGGDRGMIGGGVAYAVRISAGDFVDQIAVAYYHPSNPDNQYREGDAHYATNPIGHAGGVTYDWEYCPAGYAITGIHGSQGQAVDGINVICSEINNPANKRYLPVRGANRGVPFSLECEYNGFMSAVHVRAGSWMDALQGLCATR
ncbi:hypothetical protein [Pendulispora albinea]|uniref:Uncharacterized protein n=1 Tax=Pendulispora albinea TaxID=2741071 RepID=A0ABZ2LU15_9BACT